MLMKKLLCIFTVLIAILLVSCSDSMDPRIYYDTDSSILFYGVSKLSGQININDYSVERVLSNDISYEKLVILSSEFVGGRAYACCR